MTALGGLRESSLVTLNRSELSEFTPTRPSLWPLSMRRPEVDLEVIMPALNEEHRLPHALERTVTYLARQAWTSAVVVVDNGSVDRTSEVADLYDNHGVPIYVIGCAVPGKGAAVRRGVLSGNSRYVGFADADLATPIETLDQIMPLLLGGRAAVIGSRRIDQTSASSGRSTGRRVASAAFRTVAASLVPVVGRVADTQCGFKFFEGAVARPVFAECSLNGFAFDVELLARLTLNGVSLSEVGVEWQAIEGSTFRVVRDGWNSLRETFALRRALAAV